MVNLEIGKCYRWKSNKYELGEFVGKKDVTLAKQNQNGHPTGKTYPSVVYIFKKLTIGESQLSNLEEYDCPTRVQGGRRRRKTRRATRTARKTRVHRR